jgi:hypothetical protein
VQTVPLTVCGDAATLSSHHILVPTPIPGLASGVVEAAAPAALIAPAGGVKSGAAGPVGTIPRAVAIAAIAAAAEKEDVTAVHSSADHEPKRVHAPPRAGRGGGQSRPDMRREGGAESRAPARFGPRARSGSDSGPSPTSAGGNALTQISLARKPNRQRGQAEAPQLSLSDVCVMSSRAFLTRAYSS